MAIIDEVRRYFPQGFIGTAVELGACDGLFLSNTLDLEREGWTCLCIEPNPTLYAELAKNRKLTQNCACASVAADNVLFKIYYLDNYVQEAGLSSLKPDSRLLYNYPGRTYREVFVAVCTLDSCLQEAGFTHLDFISLDVEGGELEVLLGCDLNRWNPHLLVVENHFTDKEITEHLAQYGYRLDKRIGIDEYYVEGL